MSPRAYLALLLVLGLPLAAGAVAPPPSRVDFDGNPLPPGAVARLGTARPWLGRASGTFALSPDGKLLATTVETRAMGLSSWPDGGLVRLWELSTGRHLRAIQLEDTRYIADLTFSPDGLFLAVVGDSDVPVVSPGQHTLHVVDLRSGAAQRFRPQKAEISKVGFMGGSRWLVLATGDWRKPTCVIVWDRARARLRQRFEGTRGFACSPDGLWFATGHADATVRLRDAETGREKRLFGFAPWEALLLAFSPDGKLLAAAGPGAPEAAKVPLLGQPQEPRDPVVRLWDVGTAKEHATLEGHVLDIRTLLLAPDGRTLASTSYMKVCLWDARSGKLRNRWVGSVTQDARCCFSPDGKSALWTLDGRTFHLWDVPAARERRCWREPGGCSTACQFTPDGKSIILGGSPLRIRDVTTGEERFPGKGHRNPVCALAFSPDGRFLTTGDEESGLRLWQADTGRELPPFRGCPTVRAYRHGFLDGGARLAALTPGGDLCLWDTATGREVRRTPILASAACESLAQRFPARHSWRGRGVKSNQGVVFAPGCRVLAVVRESGQTELWDVPAGKRLAELKTAQARYSELAFSPDGRFLLSRDSDQALRLWSIPAGKLVETARGEGAGFFAFSADSALLAWGFADRVTLYDLRRLREQSTFRRFVRTLDFDRDGSLVLHTWEGIELRDRRGRPALRGSTQPHQGTWTLLRSPDGRLMGLLDPTSENEFPTVIEVETGREVFRGEPALFSPDARLALEFTPSGAVCCETASGGLIGRLKGIPAEQVTTCAFSPDGRLLATALPDHTVVLWDWRRLCGLAEPAAPPSTLPDLWELLASPDARVGWKAAAGLAAHSGRAVAFLRANVRPVREGDARPVRKLLADLDGDDYAVRQRASHELAKLPADWLPVLEEGAGRSLEARRRVRALLRGPAKRGWSADLLRRLRAVQALELVGSPEARALLKELGIGAPWSRLTQDAGDALRRLDVRH